MSNHIKVDEDYVKSLLANAAWDHVDVRIQEEVQEETPVVENTVEEHVCPLCESKLDEELADEIVLEHLGKIEELLMEDSEEEEEDVEEDVEEDKWSGQKRGDKPAKDKEGDKPDFTTGARKGDEDAEDTGKDYEGDGNGNGNGKGDPKAFGGKKGDKSKTHSGRDFEKSKLATKAKSLKSKK